jgi:hypothetical protein
MMNKIALGHRQLKLRLLYLFVIEALPLFIRVLAICEGYLKGFLVAYQVVSYSR